LFKVILVSSAVERHNAAFCEAINFYYIIKLLRKQPDAQQSVL